MLHLNLSYLPAWSVIDFSSGCFSSCWVISPHSLSRMCKEMVWIGTRRRLGYNVCDLLFLDFAIPPNLFGERTV
ncbi:hypothetical protein HanPI659440_Chr13g0501991 [Helianthus annuus]|nr:hypothetical protein HanPI659440_Chr13g0501991 [Helianthus annuus]